jgi:hypothetical protein
MLALTNFTFVWPTVHRNKFLYNKDQDGTAVPSWSCLKAVYRLVWHIPLLSVQWMNSWWWTDELSETCRVSWQNKLGKSVHVVGLIKKLALTFSDFFFFFIAVLHLRNFVFRYSCWFRNFPSSFKPAFQWIELHWMEYSWWKQNQSS